MDDAERMGLCDRFARLQQILDRDREGERPLRELRGQVVSPQALHDDEGDALFLPDVEYAHGDFKDDTWRKVTLPHDWSIEGPFDEKAPTLAAGAYLPSGVGWYRKTFTVPAHSEAKRVYIEFDGVMANSDVWINKGHLGHQKGRQLAWPKGIRHY